MKISLLGMRSHLGAGVALLALVVLSVHGGMLLAWPVQTWHVVHDFLVVVEGVAACTLLFAAALHSRRTGRGLEWAWAFLGGAAASLTAANLAWTLSEGLTHSKAFPSAGDGFYVLFFPLLLLGVTRFPVRRLERSQRQTMLLDIGIAVLAVFMVVWEFVVGPAVQAAWATSSLFEVALMVGYPICDLVAAWAILDLLLFRLERGLALPLLLVGAGATVELVTDTCFSYRSLAGTYVSGSVIDLGYAAAPLLLGLAGALYMLSPPVVAPASGSQRAGPAPVGFRRFVRAWPLYMANGWFVVAFVLLVWGLRGGTILTLPVVALGVIAIIALVAWRQFTGLRESLRLYAEVAQARDQLEAKVAERTAALTRANAELWAEVAERTKAEAALRENEEALRVLMNANPETVYLMDSRGIVLEANTAARQSVRRGADGPIGTCVYDWSPSEPAAPRREQVERVFASGQPVHFDDERNERSLLHHLYPVFDASGAVYRLAVFVVDVTEAKRLLERERQLREDIEGSQRLESLAVLAGGIAHDFNNLLTVIVGHGSLLFEAAVLAPEERKSLQAIMDAAQRASELTKQMLAYSGRGVIATEVIDFAKVVRDTLGLLEVAIPKSCRLLIQGAPGILPVEGDLAQLQQLITNLVINAAEAIGEAPGEIRLRTDVQFCDRGYFAGHDIDGPLADGTYVVFTIADTGCGMTTEVKARMFAPFFSTKFTGRGLGLAAVRGILQAHGGAVSVTSEPGRGSTFIVYLPASLKGKPHANHGFARPDVAPPVLNQVLVVDDEQSVREVLAQMLSREGIASIAANGGREAVDIFRTRRHEVACVLLDLTMPGMDGVETFTELRRLRADLPVILLSGYTQEDATSRFRDKGLTGFLQKPFSKAKLKEKVSVFLERGGVGGHAPSG